mmetsp:Transcript_10692/g.9250  ORF Transcript_10692/g.9250 Transcript_10692/m.9250 type:complete len:126 (-) Transcript_10692:1283-1660(-)
MLVRLTLSSQEQAFPSTISWTITSEDADPATVTTLQTLIDGQNTEEDLLIASIPYIQFSIENTFVFSVSTAWGTTIESTFYKYILVLQDTSNSCFEQYHDVEVARNEVGVKTNLVLVSSSADASK